MSEQSARLGLPYIQPAQSQKHVTHNEALERLDAMVQLVVESIGAQTPPALAQPGQIWALGGGATGAWAGQDTMLAAWTGDGWLFVAPQPGWCAACDGDLFLWDGAEWDRLAATDLDNLAGVGVNTSHDAVNRLAVASDASLFSHDGAGHQIKVNKAAPADTASLLFQTGWSGRAEMGTAGNDDFAIKVSPDGTSWSEALRINAASSTVTMPQGAEINGPLTGTAVTQSNNDTTPDRLIRAQDGYVRGSILGTVSQSGGVPTGAIIQRGSNANGEFVRFADGTQICWVNGRTGVRVTSGLLRESWAFPATFIPSQTVHCSVNIASHSTASFVNCAFADVGPPAVSSPSPFVSVSIGFWSSGTWPTGAEITDLSYMAIGRWF